MPFLVEMARLASTLEDRPLPAADDPVVLAVLPRALDSVVVATDDSGSPLGVAWCHVHDPPLVLDEHGEPLPELVLAVTESARGEGVGLALIEAIASETAERSSTLTLNVHLRNPSVGLYMRGGFHVAGKGRGIFGVAMSRSLRERESA
jgi:GNAT superfamily N-acetyltransferase